LQPLSFLNPVYQLIGDLAIFSAVFNVWQLVGMSIVCLVFFVELVYNWTCKESKDAASKAEAATKLQEDGEVISGEPSAQYFRQEQTDDNYKKHSA